MEQWKQLDFSKEFQEWWSASADKNGNYDKDFEKLLPKVIERTGKFDSIIKEFHAKNRESLHTPEGCVFMSDVAVKAADVAEIIASFLSTIGWKEAKQDHEETKRTNPESIGEDEEQGILFTGFQGEVMNATFDLGKLMLTNSFLDGLEDWGDGDWIYDVHENIVWARRKSYGYYSIFGIESMEKNGCQISVDCFIKNLNKYGESKHIEGFVKGVGKDRVVATTEAVMYAHWKVASIEMEALQKIKLPTITGAYYCFDHGKNKAEEHDDAEWEEEEDAGEEEEGYAGGEEEGYAGGEEKVEAGGEDEKDVGGEEGGD